MKGSLSSQYNRLLHFFLMETHKQTPNQIIGLIGVIRLFFFQSILDHTDAGNGFNMSEN